MKRINGTTQSRNAHRRLAEARKFLRARIALADTDNLPALQAVADNALQAVTNALSRLLNPNLSPDPAQNEIDSAATDLARDAATLYDHSHPNLPLLKGICFGQITTETPPSGNTI